MTCIENRPRGHRTATKRLCQKFKLTASDLTGTARPGDYIIGLSMQAKHGSHTLVSFTQIGQLLSPGQNQRLGTVILG